MKQTILVVEDEKEIADTVTYALASESFTAIWLANGEQVLSTLTDQTVDLCILDVGLPDTNGFDVLKQIRQAGHQLPVIFLTARGEEIDRIVGLELGADDYVCKPFSPRELVTRVKVVLRRSQQETEPAVPSSAEFEHKAQQRQILFMGQALDLTRAEYQLMVTFLAQPGRVFSRRQLIDTIWSNNHPSDDRAIDTHIKTLRAKLKSCNPHTDFIITHRGFGYSLDY